MTPPLSGAFGFQGPLPCSPTAGDRLGAVGRGQRDGFLHERVILALEIQTGLTAGILNV